MSDEKSYSFPVYSGLLTQAHRKKMGAAIWEYLWCLDKITREYLDDKGVLRGVVLGGKPITTKEIAQSGLGGNPESIRINLQKLADGGYIHLTRTPYGQIIEVIKSKKFVKRNQKTLDSRTQKVLESESQKSLDSESERTQKDLVSLQENLGSGTQKVLESNKTLQLDITEDNTKKEKEAALISPEHLEDNAGGVPFTEGKVPERNTELTFTETDTAIQRVMLHFQSKSGLLNPSPSDPAVIRKMLSDDIPVHHIIEGINQQFATFRPKYAGDRIGSVSYCDKKIREVHAAHKKQQSQAPLRLVKGISAQEQAKQILASKVGR